MRLFDQVVRAEPSRLGAFVVDVTEPFSLSFGSYKGCDTILTCAPPWERFFLEATDRSARTGKEQQVGLAVNALVGGRLSERWACDAEAATTVGESRWMLDCDLYIAGIRLLAMLVPVMADGRISVHDGTHGPTGRARTLSRLIPLSEGSSRHRELRASLEKMKVHKRSRSIDQEISLLEDKISESERLGDLQPGKSNDDVLQNFSGLLLWTIQFAHCKNVEVVAHDPPRKTVKLTGRKHSNDPPLVSYHVLKIHSMRRILREEGGMGEKGEGVNKALHICRGHFKDFRERGLFGKNKGLYWWDQHARGDASIGVVDKDYAVTSLLSPAEDGDT